LWDESEESRRQNLACAVDLKMSDLFQRYARTRETHMVGLLGAVVRGVSVRAAPLDWPRVAPFVGADRPAAEVGAPRA